MNFEELQKEWQAVKTEPRSHSDLRSMMYTSPTSYRRNFLWKDIVKWPISVLVGLALWAVLGYFKDWSDVVCIVLGLVAIIDQRLVLSDLRWLPQKDTLRKTILTHLSRMKMVLFLSQLVRVAVFIIAAFIIGARMNLESWSMVALGLTTLLLIYLESWWSTRKWSQKISDLKSILKELDEDSEAVGT